MDKNKKNKQVSVVVFGLLAIGAVITFSLYKAEKNMQVKNTEEVESNSEISYNSITGPELLNKIKKDEVQIIDIRNIAEFGLEHILDSINIPINDLSEETDIDLSKAIVIIGNTNMDDIKRAVSIFSNKTSKEIYILSEGFIDWKIVGGKTVTWGDITSFTDQAKTTFITVDELKDRIVAKKPIMLVDVRKKISFEEKHIIGSINVPLSEIEKRRNELSNSAREIIFYSEDELESFQASIRLYDANITPSKVLKGGLIEWENKGLKTTK